MSGLRRIYQPGIQLNKAGVMLLDLAPNFRVQNELVLEDNATSEGRGRLLTAMDALNGWYGKGTVHVASTGLPDHSRERAMKRDRRTPNYTTYWQEVPAARA